MKKNKVILISLTLCALLIIGVCVGVWMFWGNKPAPADPENDYLVTYRSDWQGENDADIQIDGSLDEPCWSNKKWYTTCAPYAQVGDDAWLETTAFTTEYGLYVAAVLHDQNIVGDGEFNITQATCLEYFYTFREADGKLYNTAYYNRGLFYMDALGNYCTEGARMKRAVQVDGEIGSGNTNSATFEIFIPWEQTSVEVTDDWYPQEVYILPGCRIVEKGSTDFTCTLGKVSGRWRRDYQAMYYEFGKDGYTKADAEGAVLGDAKNGFAKSAGWNLEALDQGILSVDKTYEYDYIFFRDAYANNFDVSMTVYPGDFLYDTDNGIVYDTNGLAYYYDGRAGFYFLTSTGQEFVPFLTLGDLIDTNEEDVKAPRAYCPYSLDNIVSDWNLSEPLANVVNKGDKGAVDFRIIKYGADLFYFADGIYLATQRVPALNDAVYVGIYNCNRSATYENFSYTPYSVDEVRSALAAEDIYPVTITTNEGGEANCEQTFVKLGESLTFEVLCYSGNTVKSVKLGQTDITEEFKRGAVKGVYTVDAVKDIHLGDGIEIIADFEELPKEELSDVDGVVYNGEDAAGATLKFASQKDGWLAYLTRANGAKGYSISLPDENYTVMVTFGSLRGLTQKVTVDGDGTIDILSHSYKNRNFIYDDDNANIIAEKPMSNANFADLIHTPSNEFEVTATFTAKQAAFPAAGFTVSDQYGNSLQFQVIDHGVVNIFRLHVGEQWYDYRMERNVDQGWSGQDGLRNCTVTLTCFDDIFGFYMDHTLVIAASVDEINDYIHEHINPSNEEYFKKGNYSVGVFSWEVKEADNRYSKEPIITVSNFSTKTEFPRVEFSGEILPFGKQPLGDAYVVFERVDELGSYTVNADKNGKYTANLREGEYYATAHNGKYVSRTAEIIVKDGEVKGNTKFMLSRLEIQVETGKMRYVPQGSVTPHEKTDNRGYIASTEKSGQAFVLEANIKNMSTSEWPSAGFILTTGQNRWVKFVVRKTDSNYDLLVWRNLGNDSNYYCARVFQFPEEMREDPFGGPCDTLNLALVYEDGKYYMFANNTRMFDLDKVAEIQNGHSIASILGSGGVRLGLFAERQATFADWDCSTSRAAIDEYFGTVSGKITGGDGNTVVIVTTFDGEVVKTANADSSGKFNIRLPNGEYYVTAQSKTQVSQTVKASTSESNIHLTLSRQAIHVERGKLFYTPEGCAALHQDTDNRGYISAVKNGQPFALEATMKDMSTAEWPSSGFILSTGENSWLKFVVRKTDTNYDMLVWRNLGSDKDYYCAKVFPFPAGMQADPFIGPDGTMKLALVYRDGTYYFYANDTLMFDLNQEAEIQNGHSAASILGTGDVNAGLFAERKITFTDWSCSTDSDDVAKYFNTVSGTVTNADADTVVTITKENGETVFTGKPDANGKYSASLVNGTYYITAQNKTSATQTVKVAVGGQPVEVETALTFTHPAIQFGSGNLFFTPAGLGTLHEDTDNRGYISTAKSGQPFILETTMKDMSASEWPSSGFILDAGGNSWVKFVVRKTDTNYDMLVWRNLGSDSDYYCAKVFQFPEGMPASPFSGPGNTMKLALVYWDGGYYFYVNDALMFNLDQNDEIQNGHSISSILGSGDVQAGLFAERQITFTDWNCSADMDDVMKHFHTASGTVENTDADTVVTITTEKGETVFSEKPDADGKFIAVLDNGTYYITAQNQTQATQTEKVTINNNSVAVETPLTFSRTAVHFESGNLFYTPEGCAALHENTDNRGYIATVKSKQSFVLETTMKGMSTQEWPSSGFILNAGGNNWVKFVVRKTDTNYDMLVWRNIDGELYCGRVCSFPDDLKTNPFKGDGGTLKLKLVYVKEAGKYGVYVNGTLMFELEENDIIAENQHTIESILGTGDVKLGLFAERQITFTDWSYSTDSMDVDHYFYAVSGTVTGGDADTVVTIVNEAGDVVFTQNAAGGSYSTYLAKGTYYITAQSGSQVSKAVMVTVNDSAVTASPVALDRSKLTAVAGAMTYDPKTGDYFTVHDSADNQAYLTTVQNRQAFELETTMKDMSTKDWPSSGFILNAGGNNWVKFVVRYAGDHYDMLVWRNLGSDQDYYCAKVYDFPTAELKANPFTGTDGTLTLKMQYAVGKYYVSVNGTQMFVLDENEVIQNGHSVASILGTGNVRAGLFAERQITFTDWNANVGGIDSAVVSGQVTGGDADTVVTIVDDAGQTVFTGNAASDGSYSATLPNGTFYITAQSQAQVSGAGTVTVTDGAVAGDTTVTLGRSKLTAATGAMTYDTKTGNYFTVHDNTDNQAYIDTVKSGQAFELETTMKGMSTSEWPSSGFILNAGGNSWIKFVVRKTDTNYDMLVWRNLGSDQDYYCAKVYNFPDNLKANPFTGTDATLTLKLVYSEGNYSVSVNGTQMFELGEKDEIQNGHSVDSILGTSDVQLGLFAERQITFTDWKATPGKIDSTVVSGTVTGGDASTVVTFAKQDRTIVGTANANADGSYSIKLPNGTYCITAQSPTQVSNAETVTVTDGAVTGSTTVALGRSKLTAEAGTMTFDPTTGNYSTVHANTNNRAYLGTVNSKQPFVLKTTMKDMSTSEGPSAGLILNAGGDNWVRFVVRKTDAGYDMVVWRDLWGTTNYFGRVVSFTDSTLTANPFTGTEDTLELALVYWNGSYYFYANDALMFELPENEVIAENDHTVASILGSSNVQLGLFAERQITFTDWSYSTDRADVVQYFYPVSGTVANAEAGTDVTIVDEAGETVLTVDGSSGSYSAKLPNGTYHITAKSGAHVSGAITVTVVDNAVTGANVTLNRNLPNVTVGAMTFDPKTGNYSTTHGSTDNQAYLTTVQSGQEFTLETTMKDMSTSQWPCSGFILNAGGDSWVKFVVRYAEDHYDMVVWRNIWDSPLYCARICDVFSGDQRTNPFTGADGTLKLKLVYEAGKYSVYVNDALMFELPETEVIAENNHTVASILGTSDVQLGLFAERQITFTDWSATEGEIPSVAKASMEPVSITLVSCTMEKENYYPGEMVTLTANEAEAGKVFSHFLVNGETLEGNTFTVEADTEYTVTAVYTDAPESAEPPAAPETAEKPEGAEPPANQTAVSITLVSCTMEKDSYYPGETVALTAKEAEAGKVFSHFLVNDETLEGNTFTVEAGKEYTVTAVYVEKPAETPTEQSAAPVAVEAPVEKPATEPAAPVTAEESDEAEPKE